MSDDDKPKAFEVFELLAALVLGLGAVGAALASWQGSNWGGNAQGSYHRTTLLTTFGAAELNAAATAVARDTTVEIDAKKQALAAMWNDDEAQKTFYMFLTKYLVVRQLSAEAYAALGCPKEFAGQPDNWEKIPDEALIDCLNNDLLQIEDYKTVALAGAMKTFDQAREKLDEGQGFDEISGKFSLVTIFYTIALFISGIALVIKTRVRWGFLGAGTAGLAAATTYLLTLPWA